MSAIKKFEAKSQLDTVRALGQSYDGIIQELVDFWKEKQRMKLHTRVFELYKGKYRNLSELAQAMGISTTQIYRVRRGMRRINERFIIGAVKAFPGYSLDNLFYVDSGPAVKSSNRWPEFREYARQKYPNELDEGLITMIEDLIERQREKPK